jgi:uncharacterized protein YggL (DUF469 family)
MEETTNKKEIGFSMNVEVPDEVAREFIKKNVDKFLDYLMENGNYYLWSFLRDSEKEMGEFICFWNREG